MRSQISNIGAAINVVKATYGLSLGCYLYTYGRILRDGFQEIAPLGWTPLEWATSWLATVFAFEIVAESLLEIPTGIIGDNFGRKRAVVLSLFLRSIWFLLLLPICLVANSTWVVFSFSFGAMTAFAFSYTLQSGTLSAWINDSLSEAGVPDSLVTQWQAQLIARGQIVFYSTFLVTACTSFGLQLAELDFVALLAGATICAFGGLYCALFMKENTSFRFQNDWISMRDAFKRFRILLWRGWDFYRKNKHANFVVILFLAQAAAIALMYVVDVGWPNFIKDSGYDEMARENLFIGIGLILIVSVPMIIGSYGMWAWLAKNTSVSRLGYAVFGIYAAFACPIILLGIFSLTLGQYEGFQGYKLAIVCLAVAGNKLFEGGLEGPIDALQNHFVHRGEQARSVILSYGVVVRGLPLAAISFLGLNVQESVLGWMFIACLVFIAGVVVLLSSRRIHRGT